MTARTVFVTALVVALLDGAGLPAIDSAMDAESMHTAARQVEVSNTVLDSLASATADSLTALQRERRFGRLFVRATKRNDSTFAVVVAAQRNGVAIVVATIQPQTRPQH